MRQARAVASKVCLIKPETMWVTTASSLGQILGNGTEYRPQNYSARGVRELGVYALIPESHGSGAAGDAVLICRHFFLSAARLSTVSGHGALDHR